MEHRSLVVLACVVVALGLGGGCGEGRSQKGGPAGSTVYTKWPFDAAEAKRRQAETAKALGVEATQSIDLGGGVKLTMVLIPAGEFTMGSPPGEPKRRNDERQHLVRISKPFWLSKQEATQEQWQAVVGTNPSHFTGDGRRPVEKVFWEDCQAFLRELHARVGGERFVLPTEAQWEYACRAGTSTPFHFGRTRSADTQANYGGYEPYEGGAKGKYLNTTTPVGSFPANAWGLHDMHGNVWEWCQDFYGDYAAGAQTNPTGPNTGGARVLRGGSFYSSTGRCRSAARDRNHPDSGFYYFGFRVARPLP